MCATLVAVASSTTTSSDEAIEMENRTRNGKRPNTLDDDGVDEPWASDDESQYSQEEGAVPASYNTFSGETMTQIELAPSLGSQISTQPFAARIQIVLPQYLSYLN